MSTSESNYNIRSSKKYHKYFMNDTFFLAKYRPSLIVTMFANLCKIFPSKNQTQKGSKFKFPET